MPKTRPGWTTGTSVSTPTPWRHVHRLLPHRVIRLARITRTLESLSIIGRTFLARGTRAHFSCYPLGNLFCLLYYFPRVHYRFPYQQSTSTFIATYATRHIITTTIPKTAGCGHQRRLTTNHRLSAMANDMSLLSITRFGTTRRIAESSRLNLYPASKIIASSDYESIRIRMRIGDKAMGPSSRRAHPIVVPARKLGDGEPGDGTRREKRRAVAPVRC